MGLAHVLTILILSFLSYLSHLCPIFEIVRPYP